MLLSSTISITLNILKYRGEAMIRLINILERQYGINCINISSYLRPIFTFGKYFEQDGKTLLPLSVQVHHAVCDGFHASRFIDEFQKLVNDDTLWRD